jgi:hypothetical protein
MSAGFKKKNILDLTRVVAPACLGHIRSADSGNTKHARRVSSFNIKNKLLLLFRKF